MKSCKLEVTPFGSVAYWFVPLSVSAFPMRPPIQAGALRSVAVLLLPVASAAVVPVVSSSFSQLIATVAAVVAAFADASPSPAELPAETA